MHKKSTASPKRNIPITISFSDEDVKALDAVIDLDPMFPPTRAEMLCILARDSMARLLKGEVSLQEVWQKHGLSPVSYGSNAELRL